MRIWHANRTTSRIRIYRWLLGCDLNWEREEEGEGEGEEDLGSMA